MNIAALKQEARETAKRLEDLLATAIEENRDLTEEEEAAETADNEKLVRLTKQIEKAEALAARTSIIPEDDELEEKPKSGKKPAEPKKNAEMNGFESFAEFGLAVKNASRPGGAIDERLAAPSNYHREGGSSDGYMVPPAMRDTIWDLVFNEGSILDMVDREPTNSNSVEMLADETTPWGATGIQAYWRSEGSQMTASRLDTDARQVKLNELYAFVSATDELLEDAPRLNRRLTNGAARAIRWKASDAIIYGSGAGQPQGWFGSGALVTVAKETSQTADTIVAANVAKMYSRSLNPGGSVWLANSDTLPQLMTMTLGDQPIWTPPSTGFQNAPGGFLFGRPVMLSEHAKTVGDKGDIQFVDPMGYYAVTKSTGVKFDSSIHLYFDYNVTAFRWTFRFGGQPYLSAPVSPANGSNTKSHFVVLAARA